LLFNTYEFIFIFLPFTFFVYFYLNHIRLTNASNGFLVFSSLFFYSWWNISYLPIILTSMLFNYIIGNILTGKNKKNRKVILFFGVLSNLSLLGYFKYTDFLIENFNFVFSSNIELLHLLLPLAISFFTFQQIAYLVDSYRHETKEYDFLNYALFVTFFPQLIAGPIVHHKEMMPQFSKLKNKLINYQNISLGLFIFSIGLFKKTAIADTFATWANIGFDKTPSLSFFEAWATSLSYTFQLYFDFSGYTDMAIGLALLFNIKLPTNFNSPYKATNIQDFWRRWHMTLSRFLKDYIYIPLGGNRKGNLKTFINLMATFLLGGIWHGAGWTFVFWGFLHGLALVIQKLWNSFGLKMSSWIAWLLTFNFVNLAWVFFRAKEWDDALKVLSGMFGLNGIVFTKNHEKYLSFLANFDFITYGDITKNIGDGSMVLNFILGAFFIVLFMKNSQTVMANFRYKTYQAFFVVISIYLLHFLSLTSVQSQFLYFNF